MTEREAYELPSIEVIVFNRHGRRHDSVEAETPADAVRAGQVLFDEANQNFPAERRFSVGFYVGGKLVRLIDGRPDGGALG